MKGDGLHLIASRRIKGTLPIEKYGLYTVTAVFVQFPIEYKNWFKMETNGSVHTI